MFVELSRAESLIQKLGQVEGADGDVLFLQATADLHEATAVAGHDCVGARGPDVVDLVLQHGAGYVRVLDAEGAAETATDLGLFHLDEVHSWEASDEGPRLLDDSKLAAKVARLVIGRF
jgi:hypothetical protein